MQATQARALLAEAKRRESYEAPIPEDDAKAVSEAEALVKMAEVAWEQLVRGPEVEAILRMAAEDYDGEPEQLAETEEKNLDGLEVFAPDPVETEIPVETPVETEAPTDGYVPPKLESDEFITNSEPWEGYADERVPIIKDMLSKAVLADSDPAGLLAHVWAYESAHKNRQRVLAHLEELGKEHAQNGEPEPEEATDHLAVDKISESPSEAEDHSGGDPEVSADTHVEPGHAGEVAEVGLSDNSGETPTDLPDQAGNSEPVEADTSAPEAQGRAEVEAIPDRKNPGLVNDDELEYGDLIVQVEQELAEHRLHVPEPPTENPPEIPYDYSRVSDGELRSLHSQFSMFAYRANYLLMRDERIAAVTRQAADDLSREILVLHQKYDEKGKEKRVAVIEAEIEQDENVKKLRKIQRKHEIFATAHRQERDSYNKLVESMSRLESMRQNEWERSRR